MTVDDSTVNSTSYLDKIIYLDLVKTQSANNLYDVFEYITTFSVYAMQRMNFGDNTTATFSFSGLGVDHHNVRIRTSMVIMMGTNDLTYTIDGVAGTPVSPNVGKIY